MSNEWLNAQSFERSYHLVSAINTVSIHNKLQLGGIDDSARLDDVREARDYLLEFFQRFQPVVQGIGADGSAVPEGIDPRLNDLARGFLNAQRQRPRTSVLAEVSVDEISRLMESSSESDQERLLECLRDLRSLVEQHAYTDVVKILGEL